ERYSRRLKLVASKRDAMNASPQTVMRTLGKLALVLSICLSAGCGTLRNGRGWGQDAVWPVQWERIPKAAVRAALDPVTWIPAVGALVFTIDDFDEKTAHWASTQQPVFRSTSTARHMSDHLREALTYETLATALLTPSGDDVVDWSLAKAKGLGVEYYGGLKLTGFTTGLLKHGVGRERPDGSDTESFPSGHASIAFAGARLSNRNLDSIELKPWLRNSLKASNLAMATATGWARVEAGRHFPADVLAGAALGNFLTTFIHDAFLNLPEDSDVAFRIEPSTRGVLAAASWSF
ncbi:MAG: phosphatase PAP2 family protein, partial [Acidobacteriales bacterium]|nr:phosphatase PAP2 family protein [Terriglobales bacterium]